MNLSAVSTVSTPNTQNFWQKASICFNCFSGGVLTSLFIYRTSEIYNRFDVCPSMPEPIYHYANTVCQVVDKYSPSVNYLEQVMLVSPSVQEALFRFGFQEMLLKKLPKTIIKQIAPSYVQCVDNSKILKVARVFTSAVAFSLIHSVHPGYADCSLAYLIETFALGIITGTFQEITGSLTLPMAFHSGYNTLPAFYGYLRMATRSCRKAIPT